MSWGTPADIRDRLRRRWERGELLAARLRRESPDDSLFPMSIPLKKPTSRDLADDFEAVRRWVGELEAGSRPHRGFGYEIEWQEIRHRVHGRNRLPVRVTIPSESDALRLIGRRETAERFDALAAETGARFPELADWLSARPMKLLEHAENWDRVLAVVDWLRTHP
ncbi:MAG: DUF3322 domain-containing protein, partial [Guyparkeria sp.]